MDRDDYLLRSLPKDKEPSCPHCGSTDYFYDKKKDEYVCRDCWTRTDIYGFHYDSAKAYTDRELENNI